MSLELLAFFFIIHFKLHLVKPIINSEFQFFAIILLSPLLLCAKFVCELIKLVQEHNDIEDG